MLNKTTVEALQGRLKELGHYSGPIDGLRGPGTDGAAAAHLASRPDDLPEGFTDWSARRKIVAFLQLWCHDVKIDAGKIDGFWGPQTDWATDALLETLETGDAPDAWRDEVSVPANPRGWPKEAGIRDYYGPPGRVDNAPTPPPPLVKVTCPWKLRIAWDLRHHRTFFRVHEKVADSLGEVLEKVHAHYGEAEIERLGLDLFGGDYNARLKRGGSSMSTHSWGIAIDFDPGNNRLKWGRERARFAHADYSDWWGFWEAEGWVSLGRSRNFDWMHVQAARLREG